MLIFVASLIILYSLFPHSCKLTPILQVLSVMLKPHSKHSIFNLSYQLYQSLKNSVAVNNIYQRIDIMIKIKVCDITSHVLFQTGLSGNIIMLSVLYSGGMMMTDAQISVGDLTSFLLYAGFVGISFGGN